MTVNIRYCGGCNPRYNRGDFARKLQATFPDFTYCFNSEVSTDIEILFCGCTAACIATNDDYTKSNAFVFQSAEKLDSLCSFMQAIN